MVVLYWVPPIEEKLKTGMLLQLLASTVGHLSSVFFSALWSILIYQVDSDCCDQHFTVTKPPTDDRLFIRFAFKIDFRHISLCPLYWSLMISGFDMYECSLCLL